MSTAAPTRVDAVSLRATGGFSTLLTVIRNVGDQVKFSQPSMARTRMLWLPFGTRRVSQRTSHGAARFSPMIAPSKKYCTFATSVLSAGVVAIVVTPATVAPAAGALSVIVGAMPSAHAAVPTLNVRVSRPGRGYGLRRSVAMI